MQQVRVSTLSSLGLCPQVGDLYNQRDSTFLPRYSENADLSCLVKTVAPQKSSLDVSISKDIWKDLSIFELTEEQLLNILLERCIIGGSLLYLKDPHVLSERQRLLIVWTGTNKSIILPPPSIQEVIESGELDKVVNSNPSATHMTTVTKLGSRMIVSAVTKQQMEPEKEIATLEKLKDDIYRIDEVLRHNPTKQELLQVCHAIEEDAEDFIKRFNFSFFTDSQNVKSLSEFFAEKFDFENKLATKSFDCSFALMIGALSLRDDFPVLSDENIRVVSSALLKLSSMVSSAQSLSASHVINNFRILRENVDNLLKYVEEVKDKFRNKMLEVLPKIVTEDDVRQLISFVRQSEFDYEVLRIEIDNQKKMVEILSPLIETQAEFIGFEREAESAKYEIRLTVQVPVTSSRNSQSRSNTTCIEYTSKEIERFVKYCQSSRRELVFTVKEVPSQNDVISAYISLYEDGSVVEKNFEPRKLMNPTEMCVSKLDHESIEISFDLPANQTYAGFEVTYYETDDREDRKVSKFFEYDDVDLVNNIASIPIYDLKPWTQYQIELTVVGQFTRGHPLKLRYLVRTLPCSPPIIEKIEKVSPCKMRCFFKKPNIQVQNAKLKQVFVKTISACHDGETKEHVKLPAVLRDGFFDLDVIRPDFYNIEAHLQFEEDTNVDFGGVLEFNLQYSKEEKLKMELMNSSHLVQREPQEVYELQMATTFSDEKAMVRRMEFGSANVKTYAQEKVIMIVGETGSGKTTLVNSMINYLFGVKYEEPYRFKIVVDAAETARSQNTSQSQTQYVTSYTLHHNDFFSIPYTLTIIDTPGFGDTGGIMNDKKITDRIGEFFRSKEVGVDHLDAIGFVISNSNARLTPTQRYIFDSVFSLFGKDVKSNIYLFVTFADAEEPPVLAAIQDANIEYNIHIKFNNSAIFTKTSSKDKSNSMAARFNEMFWTMGIESFKNFFDHLDTTTPKSITLTKDVLDERQRLETYITGIQQDIQKGLLILSNLEKEMKVVHQHKADISRCKNFTYTVDEEIAEQEEIPAGTYITNCLVCNRTCHYPCHIPEDKEKARCSAMNKKGFCKVCPNNCEWSHHRNMTFRYVTTKQTVTKTAEDLKRKYEFSKGQVVTAEAILEKIVGEFIDNEMNVAGLTLDARKSLERLSEIALRPNPLSEVDYIDKLIYAEEQERRAGFQERTRQLRNVRELATFVDNLRSGNFVPFENHIQRITSQYPDFQYKERFVERHIAAKKRTFLQRRKDDVARLCPAKIKETWNKYFY